MLKPATFAVVIDPESVTLICLLTDSADFVNAGIKIAAIVPNAAKVRIMANN